MLSRILLLLAAALALPCCSGDIGSGETQSIVTVRVSEGLQEEQGLGASDSPSLSFDGLLVAFASRADNLALDDGNGFSDILVKDRETGQVDNITNIDTVGSPVLRVDDSTSPVITPDGRYVAFLTKGKYDQGLVIGATNIVRPFLFDRVTRTYSNIRIGATADPLNDQTIGIALSAAGRYMAFETPATNIWAGTGGKSQIYLCDFGVNRDQCILTLVSHTSGSLTSPCGADCHVWPGGISGDGELVVFQSGAGNLVAGETDAASDVYLWHRSSGAVTLASVSTMSSFNSNLMPSISGDGTTVAYYSFNLSAPFPIGTQLIRMTLATGQRQSISDPAWGDRLVSPPALSADGTRVVCMVGLSGGAQMAIWIEGQGFQLVSRSTSGKTTGIPSVGPAISGDGRWAAWSSTTNVFVPGDSNGASDVFLRGPF